VTFDSVCTKWGIILREQLKAKQSDWGQKYVFLFFFAYVIMWWLLNTAKPVSVLSKLSKTASLLLPSFTPPKMSRTTEVGLGNPGGGDEQLQPLLHTGCHRMGGPVNHRSRSKSG